MKLKVTEQGVLIPKEFLVGIEEVEIRRENDAIIITSTNPQTSIWQLGSNPIDLNITDASINHNKYLYPDNE